MPDQPETPASDTPTPETPDASPEEVVAEQEQDDARPGSAAQAAGSPGDDPADEVDERSALVARAKASGISPPPPPRRTGIFVDAEELREYVGAQLRSMLGGYEVDALGNFTFTADSSRVFVTVGPGPMGPHVGVYSITNVGIALTPELAGFLLTTNHRMAFGAFSYEAEQQAVWLRHSLLGGTLDGPELRGAVISIASTASKVSGLLTERFGGGSFEEASEEVRAAVHPPAPAEDDEDVNAAGYL